MFSGGFIRTCLPSIASIQLLKFHFSVKPCVIDIHSYYVLGTCKVGRLNNIYLNIYL